MTGLLENNPFPEGHPSVQSLEPTPTFEITLLDFAGEVGTFLSDHQAGRFANNRTALRGLEYPGFSGHSIVPPLGYLGSSHVK